MMVLDTVPGFLPSTFYRCARVILGILPSPASLRLSGVQFHNPVELYRSFSAYELIEFARPTSCGELGDRMEAPFHPWMGGFSEYQGNRIFPDTLQAKGRRPIADKTRLPKPMENKWR
jgi:hypothetical protein